MTDCNPAELQVVFILSQSETVCSHDLRENYPADSLASKELPVTRVPELLYPNGRDEEVRGKAG